MTLTLTASTTPDEAAAPPRGDDATTLLGTVDQLLRDRGGTLERLRRQQDLAGLARAMIVTIAVGGALFGAALGAHRGHAQILFAAIKLPLVLLLTAAICAPALTALQLALDRPAALGRDLGLVLSSLALTTLTLAAEAPLLLLAVNFNASYHQLVLLTVLCCGVGGAIGLAHLWRGLGGEPRRWIVGAALLGVFALVGSQMTWTLRPFIVRPRAQSLAFMRPVESNFLEAVYRSLESATGVYHRAAAPLPGEVLAP